MNRLTHAHLARRLIDACGGGVVAAKICRVGNSQLSDYCQPHGEGFMPADVIADLETFCGEPIYSQALFENRPGAEDLKALVTEACEAAEAGTELQREIRLAAENGVLTPAEKARLARKHGEADRQLKQVGRLLTGDDA